MNIHGIMKKILIITRFQLVQEKTLNGNGQINLMKKFGNKF